MYAQLLEVWLGGYCWICLVPPLGSVMCRSWYPNRELAVAQARVMGWPVAGEDDIPVPEEEPAQAKEEVAAA